MTDEQPQFTTKEEYVAWARKHGRADPQFCAEHWAPFALREIDGGALFSVIYLTDLVLMDEVLAKRAGGDPNLAMHLAAPFCCHYGEEVYAKVIEEVTAPDEWLYECQMVPRPGGPSRRCRGVLHDECREARERRMQA